MLVLLRDRQSGFLRKDISLTSSWLSIVLALLEWPGEWWCRKQAQLCSCFLLPWVCRAVLVAFAQPKQHRTPGSSGSCSRPRLLGHFCQVCVGAGWLRTLDSRVL